MVCGNPFFLNQFPSVASSIPIGNAMVQFSTSVRNLGLVLDDRLSWNEHVNEVGKRTNTLLILCIDCTVCEIAPLLH